MTSTTINRSVDRWGRIRPSTSVSPSREARLTVDAVARGTSGRALVLGPDKEISDVALTPAHACSPWRELAGPTRTRRRDETADGESVARPRTLSRHLHRPSPSSISAGGRRPSAWRATSSSRVTRRWSANRVGGSETARRAPRPAVRCRPVSPSALDTRQSPAPRPPTSCAQPGPRVAARAPARRAAPAPPTAACSRSSATPTRPLGAQRSAACSRDDAATPSLAARANAPTTSRRCAPPCGRQADHARKAVLVIRGRSRPTPTCDFHPEPGPVRPPPPVHGQLLVRRLRHLCRPRRRPRDPLPPGRPHPRLIRVHPHVGPA